MRAAFTFVREGPLLRDEFSKPSENRVRPRDCGDFLQFLPPDGSALDSQSTPVFQRQSNPLFLNELSEHSVLVLEVINDFEVLLIDPASPAEHQQALPNSHPIHHPNDLISQAF